MLGTKELKEKRRKHIDAAKVIREEIDKGDSRPPTAEERKKIDEHLAEARSYKEKIEDAERFDAIDAEDVAIPPNEVNFRKLSTEGVGDPPGETRKAAAEPKQSSNPWSSFGEYLVANARAERSGGRDVDKRLYLIRAATGASEGIPSDGGFFVQTDHATKLLQNTYDQGSVLSRVHNITVGPNANGLTVNGLDETSRADGYRFGGVRGYWLAEAGTKTASKPIFRRIELKLKKMAALFYATDELLQDTVALGQVAGDLFAKELKFQLEDAIINGTGAGMPVGILASPALITQSAEVGQVATTIVAENILNMYPRMSPDSMSNAVWFINQDCQQQFPKMHIAVGTGGVPVYMPPGGLSGAPYGTLMGRPVIPIEFCATLGTVGDIIFADLNHYMMIDKGGVQTASSIHVEFTTDQTVYRWVMRTDGQPDLAAPLTPYKGTTTTGPFIALESRT